MHTQNIQFPLDYQFYFLDTSQMATVTSQASAAVFRPTASKSRFLSGASGKLNREVFFKPSTSSSYNSFKVEAKKGEWLPGLTSPTYLDGRYVCTFFFDIMWCILTFALAGRLKLIVFASQKCIKYVYYIYTKGIHFVSYYFWKRIKYL